MPEKMQLSHRIRSPEFWRRVTPSFALLTGLPDFWASGGVYTFAPGHLGWIMAGIDMSSHHEGWQFFAIRHEGSGRYA